MPRIEKPHTKAPMLQVSPSRVAFTLISLEYRLLLFDEGRVGTLIVLGLHADSLRLSLRLDRIVDAHAPFLVNAAFSHCVSECRTIGEGACETLRFRQHDFRLTKLVIKAPSLGLATVHCSAGI